MSHLLMMTATGAALAKTNSSEVIDPDSVVVPIHRPKRLPYHPSIPAVKLRRIVVAVVKERIARERLAAPNAESE